MNDYYGSGRLTKDVEQRQTTTGKTVASFTVAIDSGFGENKKTIFLPCTAWNKTAENIARFFSKGSKITVIGELQQRSWDDTDGKKHTVTELLVNRFEFMGDKQDRSEPPVGKGEAYELPQGGHFPIDDDIPF